jgi:predicted Zn-dependent peptidase
MGTRPDNLELAREGLRREMARLRDGMAGEEEIRRVRAERRGRALMRRMTAINRARYLGLRAMTGVPAHEDLDALDAMDRVTREDLARLGQEWLEAERFRVVIVR